MSFTFGSRPEDVVSDGRGNTLTGVTLTLYASRANAEASVDPLDVVTTVDGKWSYESETAMVLWARTPNGHVFSVASVDATEVFLDAIVTPGTPANQAMLDAVDVAAASKPDLAAEGEESATKALRANDARLFPKGVIADGTDINTIRTAGVYIVPTVAAAGTMVNWPTNRAGALLVGKASGASATTQDVIAYVSTTAQTERYSRANISASNSLWTPWSVPGWPKGTLPASSTSPVNLDTYRSPGAWVVNSLTYVSGQPAGAALGVLEVVVTSGSGLSFQRYTERVANDNVRIWHRYTLSTAGWAGVDWQLLSTGGGASETVADPVSDHATRVEYAKARRGGGVGTGGKAVVMLRFDHWLLAFRDTVLPILRTHQLPSTLNVNYDNIGLAANGGGLITWTHVQDWNQYDGVEIANHGATHTNANTRDTIYHEVVEGRRLLETAMPRVAVETWHEHGSAYLTATDIDGDTGLNLGRTPSSFTESYAGKLVMAEHAIVEGKCGGFFVNLNGSPQIGQSHLSIDRDTAAEAIAQVETAKTLGRGVTLYLHPGLLDTSSDGITYMTSAAFTELCAYLAAERDAGRIMVMTAAGGAFADKSHSRRENLLVKSDFTTGYGDWWTGTTGWTIGTPGAGVTLTSSASPGTLTQGMLLHSRFGWAMGAAHELVIRAKAGVATSLTLRIEKTGDAATWSTERVFTVAGDNVERDYRLNITLPRDPDITQMTVKISGASLTIVGPPLLAAI